MNIMTSGKIGRERHDARKGDNFGSHFLNFCVLFASCRHQRVGTYCEYLRR